MFQSTRPQGARRLRKVRFIGLLRFNPRARRGRDRRTDHRAQPIRRFNPRARRGRDFILLIQIRRISVSIHAPAGGATIANYIVANFYRFQSTRPQGARPPIAFICSRIRMFQSTRPQGARLDSVRHIWTSLRFQSTRPQGARQNARFGVRYVERFNPRARRGRDSYIFAKESRLGVSIHAPAGGATYHHDEYQLFWEFQSTRPQGARRSCSIFGISFLSFNPRARRGRDLILPFNDPRWASFNPRARRGRDQWQR